MCQTKEQLVKIRKIMEETNCTNNFECIDKYYDHVCDKNIEDIIIVSCEDFHNMDKDYALNKDIVYLCPILSYVIDILSE